MAKAATPPTEPAITATFELGSSLVVLVGIGDWTEGVVVVVVSGKVVGGRVTMMLEDVGKVRTGVVVIVVGGEVGIVVTVVVVVGAAVVVVMTVVVVIVVVVVVAVVGVVAVVRVWTDVAGVAWKRKQ